MEPINRLIDSLDEQTPQVSIEARIVETDREFERDLGITWGANAKWDPSLGHPDRPPVPPHGRREL